MTSAVVTLRPSQSCAGPGASSTTCQAKRQFVPVERGKKTSMSASMRAREPGGPATTSGRVRLLRNWASSRGKGSPPKWSPCRWLMTMPSIVLGSIPCAFNATSEEAPKSMRMVRPAVSTLKHVLNRPPDPNASPDPTMVSFMWSGPCARTRRDLAVPAPHVDELLRKREPRRTHEVDGDETGDVGDGEMIAHDVELILQLNIEN